MEAIERTGQRPMWEMNWKGVSPILNKYFLEHYAVGSLSGSVNSAVKHKNIV